MVLKWWMKRCKESFHSSRDCFVMLGKLQEARCLTVRLRELMLMRERDIGLGRSRKRESRSATKFCSAGH